jgi:hypothetical protein
MNDYSDLLYTIMSIVIFSFLLLQANSLILRNESVTVDHEYEKTAIALAQSMIEEAKRTAFDENMNPNNIPQNFRARDDFGPPTGFTRDEFTVFDHYDGHEEEILTQLGIFRINVTVVYVENPTPDIPGSSYVEVSGKRESKRMTVTATSLDNGEAASLSYIKYYFVN